MSLLFLSRRRESCINFRKKEMRYAAILLDLLFCSKQEGGKCWRIAADCGWPMIHSRTQLLAQQGLLTACLWTSLAIQLTAVSPISNENARQTENQSPPPSKMATKATLDKSVVPSPTTASPLRVPFIRAMLPVLPDLTKPNTTSLQITEAHCLHLKIDNFQHL